MHDVLYISHNMARTYVQNVLLRVRTCFAINDSDCKKFLQFTEQFSRKKRNKSRNSVDSRHHEDSQLPALLTDPQLFQRFHGLEVIRNLADTPR